MLAAKRAARATAKTQIKKEEAKEVKRISNLMMTNAQISGQRAMSRAGAATAKSEYLRTLLDPETHGPSCYPDDFGDKVTLGKFILSKTVQVDSQGNFAVWANPTLNNALAYPPVSAGYNASYGLQQEYSQEKGDKKRPRVIIDPTVGNWNYVQFVNGPEYTDAAGEIHRLEVTEATKIQLPKNYTTCQLLINAAGTAPWSGTTLAWQVRLPGGTTFAVTPGTPLAISTGLTWIQLQVSRTAGTNKDYLAKLDFALSVTSAANNAPWVFEDVPDYDLLAGDNEDEVEAGNIAAVDYTTPLYMEYRPVAMSLLVSFVGNELYNGGVIAAKYLSGGETPGRLNYPTFEELAQVPNAFQGPLKTGAYCYWKPTDPSDVSFREVDYENIAGDLPSLYVVGKATDPTNTQIRLRYCLCVEAKTTRQILPTLFSRINPDEIAMASQALQSLPNCMENPLHLEKIRNFLSGVVRKGEEFWAKYQRPIMAAATAAKTVAPLFLAA